VAGALASLVNRRNTRPALQPKPPTTFPDSLSGLIERVTFHNEDTGFAVLKVKTKGLRDLVAVVGSLASVSPGEWINAQGRWVQDREFGQQFRAEMLTSTAPPTREGIEKYLGNGMVKGIGLIYAKKLVETFGEQIFDIVETQSARLEDVGGIGPKRRSRIKGAGAEQKVIRDIMVFLHSHGVSTSRAARIHIALDYSPLRHRATLLPPEGGGVKRAAAVVRVPYPARRGLIMQVRFHRFITRRTYHVRPVVKLASNPRLTFSWQGASLEMPEAQELQTAWDARI